MTRSTAGSLAENRQVQNLPSQIVRRADVFFPLPGRVFSVDDLVEEINEWKWETPQELVNAKPLRRPYYFASAKTRTPDGQDIPDPS